MDSEPVPSTPTSAPPLRTVTLLSYATPAQRVMPALVKVVAITGICIGLLMFLVDFLGLYSNVERMISRLAIGLTFYRIDRLISSLVFSALAATLVTTSIGCLRRKEQARVWIVRYSIGYLIASVLDLVTRPLIEIVPGLLRFGAVRDPGMYQFLMMDAMRTLVTDAVMCPLPIVILIYMTRPRVRQSFGDSVSS